MDKLCHLYERVQSLCTDMFKYIKKNFKALDIFFNNAEAEYEKDIIDINLVSFGLNWTTTNSNNDNDYNNLICMDSSPL